MPDFNVRSDSVNVEQIMEQIRARIREKRGVDYTEQQLREMAAVKLEKVLDPRGVRSDLLEQFKRRQPVYDPPILPSFAFEDTTMYETHHGAVRFIRRLLNPILKLFFNPGTITHALHTQAHLNAINLQREADREKQRMEIDALYFEVIHNLVFEMTRLGIDTKNAKMRVESIASRLEFNERRARALESVVAYRQAADSDGDRRDEPQAAPPRQQNAPRPQQDRWTPPPTPPVAAGSIATSGSVPSAAPISVGEQPNAPGFQGPPGSETPGQRSRRRRRRRGRRGGGSAAAVMGQPGGSESDASRQAAAPSTPPPAGGDQPAVEAHENGPAASNEPPRTADSTGPDTDTDPQ